jgi:hypothetical protein
MKKVIESYRQLKELSDTLQEEIITPIEGLLYFELYYGSGSNVFSQGQNVLYTRIEQVLEQQFLNFNL